MRVCASLLHDAEREGERTSACRTISSSSNVGLFDMGDARLVRGLCLSFEIDMLLRARVVVVVVVPAQAAVEM